MTTAVAAKYEIIIGVEVHAQLSTRSKMFCRCSSEYAAAPADTHVCPICLGMPGVLPVINEQAVEFTIMTALALNCSIPERSKFDRKNYPYPDLMKGYQISQYDMPFSRNGWLEIEANGEHRKVGITRVHLEEDTARLVHRADEAGEAYSLVDVNRAGCPLMEIVSEPDMRSPEEARQYAIKLRQILRYIGVSTADMEEGSFRCEPNISLRPVGSDTFGTKVELKNINSFRAVYRGLEYEVRRQMEVLESGERVVQETRGWREDLGQTVSQRSKEYAHDYRYFPEPDLPVMTFTREYVEGIRAGLPELPDAKRGRFVEQYGLTPYEASILTEARERADYFEACLVPVAEGDRGALHRRAKAVANWMLGDFARLLNNTGIDIAEARVRPEQLYDMMLLVEDGTITGTAAKAVFEEMFATGKGPRQVVEERGLTQISATDEITAAVEKVLAENPKAVADYRGGKQEAVKFLVGQVMRQTRGRANAGVVQQLLREHLDS
jgi:aspartyl-tRNA(Asn)/glutamyl-tRNA(Gln) amidotransferase subunit B